MKNLKNTSLSPEIGTTFADPLIRSVLGGGECYKAKFG